MKRVFKATVTFIAPQKGFTATAFSASPKKAIQTAQDKAHTKAINGGATNWGGDYALLVNPYGKTVLNDFLD